MEVPWSNVVTGIFTVFGVIIANKLGTAQSGREKLWDLRQPAYGVILSELLFVEGLCDLAAEEIQAIGYQDYFETSRDRINGQINERMLRVRNKYSDNYLIFSDDFISKFSEFLREVDYVYSNEKPDENDENFSRAIRKHRPLLLRQARTEVSGCHRI